MAPAPPEIPCSHGCYGIQLAILNRYRWARDITKHVVTVANNVDPGLTRTSFTLYLPLDAVEF